MRPRSHAPLAALLLGLLWPLAARGDELSALENGINSYESSRFDECVERFDRLLAPGGPAALVDPELRKKARIYDAACLMGLRRGADADAQMRQLIRDDYQFLPDRAAFPSKVLDRFTELRIELKDEIQRAAEAALKQAAEERAKEDARRKQEAARLALLTEYAGHELVIQRNSRLIALLPFGVGQFQNRQPLLGWLFFGAEAALAGVSLTTYFINSSIASQANNLGGSALNLPVAQHDLSLTLTVNRLSFGGLLAVAVGGILQAQVTYVPEFRSTEERKLPPVVSGLGVSGERGGASVSYHGSF